MSKQTKFDELTDAELEHIKGETIARDAVEPRAASARYDRKNDRLIVELKTGVVLSIPSHLLQGVAGAGAALIAKVEIDSRGYSLHWEELDAALSVPGLLAGVFGSPQWMNELQANAATSTISAQAMGRKGGSARTPKKQLSSRANGKLGGRPRIVSVT